MKVITFEDGTQTFFDNMEMHGDQVLFFRNRVGLVNGKHITEVRNAKIRDNDSHSINESGTGSNAGK